jgi:tetratricopeptide (TPR) repeat protein
MWRQPVLLLVFFVSHARFANAQVSPKATTAPGSAIKLAETGHCSEALPQLKTALRQPQSDKQVKRRIGLDGVHCAMTLNRPADAVDFLQALTRDFPHDPEVLYVAVHAYSDLSTQAAQQLAQNAPQSYQAHELNAEALEMQGKWDDAAKEYRWILQQDPKLPGIHFRLGRLLLSKPDVSPSIAEEAGKEMEQELKIDPSNAGAEYVLGELARQSQNWSDASAHFARASKLDPGFGDAFLGLGDSLISAKKFSDAIAPLETAAKLEPGNPAVHYSLATAYSRTGRKQEADREFALHREMTKETDTPKPPENGAASQSPQ